MEGGGMPCLAFSLFMLAQTGVLPDPKSAESVGWFVLTAAAAAAAINQGASFWQKVNPKETPPNHEKYATKSELAKLEADHEEEMKRIEQRFETWLEQNDKHHREEMRLLNDWKDTMSKWQADIASGMGKLQALFELAIKPKK